MFAEADAFLEAIFAAPDDDTPRLVYADWLEEHGHPAYAQLIRLQCEAAHRRLWSDEANRLWEEIGRVWPRVSEAFSFGRDDWYALWPPPLTLIDAIHFHRGFLRSNQISVRYEQLARNWSTWWPWFPTPNCTLAPHENWEAAAAECRTLSRVRRLHLFGWMSYNKTKRAQVPRTFLASPLLANLRELDLSDHVLDIVSDWGIKVLTAPGILPAVRSLRVRVGDIPRFSGMTGDPIPCTAAQPGSPLAQLEARFGKVIVVPAGEW